MSGSARKYEFKIFGKRNDEDLNEGVKQASEDLKKLLDDTEKAYREEKLAKPQNKYSVKYVTKHRAKKKIKTKFKIGRYYFLRIKPKDGSADVIIKYQCIKTVYSIKDIQINVVIMKQITPYQGKKYTLDKHDCEKFHIKFEPGLEVWPMELNWIPEKKTA